jgi:ATP-dependent DNA helicase RecG
MINFGHETEELEFKKTTGELHNAVIDIVAILNKHEKGTLYFGVLPNGDVKGFQIVDSTLRDVSRVIFESISPQIYPQIEKITIDGRDIIEVRFDGTNKPYSAYGKYYIRVADESRELSPEELKSMMLEGVLSEKWERRETEYSFEDVDKDALKAFYEKAVACGRLPADPFDGEKLLSRLGLLKNGRLNNAGNVLFGGNGPVVIKMAVFATNEKLTFLDISRLENNVFRLTDEAMSYVNKNIRWRAEIDGLYRKEIPEIPQNALREIIVNSFAHAQYGSASQHEIDIHPGKVVIYNPGEFPPKLTPEDFVRQDLPSVLRNELIAKTLYLCHDIESFGSGFRRVFGACGEAGVKIGYNKTPFGFSFTFYRNDLNKTGGTDTAGGTDREKTGSARPDGFTPSEAAVYELLKDRPDLTREELSGRIGKSLKTVQRALDSLRAKQLIERVGTAKSGYWNVR